MRFQAWRHSQTAAVQTAPPQITQAVLIPPDPLSTDKLQQKNTYNFISYLNVTTLLSCIKCCDLKNTLILQQE